MTLPSLKRQNSVAFQLLVLILTSLSAAGALTRPVPQPLPRHPGNIFLRGEEVVLPLPSGRTNGWRVVDYADNVIAEIPPAEKQGRAGRLPVGFYRLKPIEGVASEWISFAVLATLQAPTPLSSPVGLDVAMAWFYKEDKMEAAANLCALAGVNWVRDRLNWGEMEKERGKFASSNRYDASSLFQSQASLQVLQVNHISPRWANANSKRFLADLRDAYRFHKEMAKRWQGQVLAFEPWNEADITMFGGHTGSEMASFQKAAWWGLKAGNSNVIACWNVFAMHQKSQLEDVRDNEAWPYFDTFNLHHYAPLHEYSNVYADFRAISAGKPLWVTECSVPVKWAGDEKLKEPAEADLRVQAERVAKTFAHSIYQGSAVTYYFLLPHYVEHQTQFGILRSDLTPRPAYVALAAVGRLLADAQPLGQWITSSTNNSAFLFRAKPDGKPCEVLVAWSGAGQSELELPASPFAVFDHLGREVVSSPTAKLNSAPQFFLFPSGTAKKLTLKSRPQPAPRLEGAPSPVVLQAVVPVEKVVLAQSCYKISERESLALNVYNFGAATVQGALAVEAPKDWKASLPERIELAPGEKKELELKIEAPPQNSAAIQTLRITGEFGPAGKPLLSARLKVEGEEGKK